MYLIGKAGSVLVVHGTLLQYLAGWWARGAGHHYDHHPSHPTHSLDLLVMRPLLTRPGDVSFAAGLGYYKPHHLALLESPHICRGPFDAGPDLSGRPLKYPPHLCRDPFEAGPGLSERESFAAESEGLGHSEDKMRQM